MIVLPLVLGSALTAPSPALSPPEQVLSPGARISALTAAVLQEEEEYPADGRWHGSLDVGLSKSEGNADIETYAITGKAVREIDVHRYNIDALWYYATQDGVRTQRRALLRGKYDQFFAEKAFFYVQGLAETNEQALVDLRWTGGGGLGYQWRDDDYWKISTEAGLNYFDERFDNGDERSYTAVRVAWSVFAQITSTLSFGHDGEIYPSLDDKDDVYGLANTYFEAILSANMIARLSWLLTYDNTPTLGPDGNRLDRADNLYLLSVGWSF
ncbi:MAG: DUF481 domain-containing protein [Planctomycetota bacterium]